LVGHSFALQNLISTAFACYAGDLKNLAQELLELVQNRVGTSKFADVYNRIRQSVASVRRERKMERKIQVRYVVLNSATY
jgi:hypothetical protein